MATNRLRSSALFAAACGLFVASTLAIVGPTIFFEIEPNDDKASANHVPLFGSSGFTAIEGTGNIIGADRDYFELESGPLPISTPEVYQYNLFIDWISTLNVGFLRGLEHTPAGILFVSDSPVQNSNFANVSHLKWYGFGKGTHLYLDMGDMDFFRFDYHVDFNRSLQFVDAIPGIFSPGEITITTAGQGHVTDTDLWVYDARLNALPGYGNDDDLLLASTRSTLTRRYAPGRYHLALTHGNLANDERAAPEDLTQGEPVMDFPDIVVSSGLAPFADLSFRFTDDSQVVDVSAMTLNELEVLWYTFDVGRTQAIQPYCAGSAGTACPCQNDSFEVRGDGCLNSTGRGGLLYASGSTSAAHDDLRFHASGLPAGGSALLFSGDLSLGAGDPFGDGLRCVGGNIRRLETLTSDAQGKATWTETGAITGYGAGSVGFFQVWYRDTFGPCGQTFNTTNALEVQFMP